MARILITSGPTRQYLDPVRYLTNASSGRMGCSLAEVALECGHQVTIVSGPVELSYPKAAKLIKVETTSEMLEVARDNFNNCDGLIGVAAPCDYQPVRISPQKIIKTGEPLELHLVETPDIVASLADDKQHRWVVGFALETEDHRFRALMKLEAKSCDLIILNEIQAIGSLENKVEIIGPHGEILACINGNKNRVASEIFCVIQRRLIDQQTAKS